MRKSLVLPVVAAFGLTTLVGAAPSAQAVPCGQGCYGQWVQGKYLMGQSAPSDRLLFENYSAHKVKVEYSDPTYGAQSATVNRSGDGNGNGDSVTFCADETYQYTNFVTITYGVDTPNPTTETVEYYSSSGGGNDDVATKQRLLNKAEAKLAKAQKALVKAQKALKKAKKGKKANAAKKVRKAKAQVRKARAQVRSARQPVIDYRVQLREAREMTAYCVARRR